MKGLKVLKIVAWIILIICGLTCTDQYTLVITVLCGLALISYIDITEIVRWKK